MDMKKISDITLERYLLKELDKTAMAEVEARLAKDPQLRARLDALRESTENILSKYDPHYLASKISEGLKSGSPNSGSKKSGFDKANFRMSVENDISSEFSNPVYEWFHHKRHALGALFSAVAVMTVIILVLPPNLRKNDKKKPVEIAQIAQSIQEDDTIRLKGKPLKLFIYRKKNSEIEMLSNNASAQKGDLLQIAYFSAKETYGMIFSLDGRGNLTVHYPQPVSSPASLKEQTFEKLKSNEKVLLPASYELDDAPAYEHFFLLTSNKKIHIDEVLAAVKEQVSSGLYEKNKNLKLDPSLEIESLLLNKVK